MTRSTNMEHVEVLRRMRNEWPLATDEGLALDAAIAALSAQQPAATLPNVDDDDLTVAYMAGRHDGRKEAQQPAAVDAAWQKQLADALDCFWNAAIRGAGDGQGNVIGGMVEGFAAVAEALRKHAPQQGERDAQIAQLEKANEQLHAHGERMHAGIEQLRAAREVIGAEALKYADKSGRLEAEVDRLAEALRDALECGEDGDWQSARNTIRAALRDHDQEDEK